MRAATGRVVIALAILGLLAATCAAAPAGAATLRPRARGTGVAGVPAPAPPGVVRASRVVAYPTELPPGRLVAPQRIAALAMAGATTGWALGGPLGSTYPLRTTDGGRRWRVAGPALFLPTADAPDAVGALAADGSSAAVAWGGVAGGSTVAVTTDAGRVWWRASLGAALEAAGGPAGDLWAVAAGDGGGSGAPGLWRYTSTDGGRTWRFAGTVPGAHGWLADLARPAGPDAYLLATGFPGPGSPAAGSGVLAAAGGGWARRPDPCRRAGLGAAMDRSEALAAARPGSIWMLCGGPTVGGGQAKAVADSTDGGRTWRVTSARAPGDHAPPGAVPLAGRLPTAGETGRVAAASPLGTLVVLTGGGLVAGTGGGTRWAPAAPAVVEAQGPEQVSVAGGEVFVLTRGGLWVEGGGRWRLADA